jgi:hypothetical protein
VNTASICLICRTIIVIVLLKVLASESAANQSALCLF